MTTRRRAPSLRSIVPALSLGLLLSACGASRKAPETPATQQAPSAEPASASPAFAQPPGDEREDQNGAPPSPPSGEAAAPSSSYGPKSKAGAAPDSESDELAELTRRLTSAITLSTPDCTTAWSLRDRICDLAQRICDMAGRSADPDVGERCTDGRTRCERATTRVRSSCPE